MNVLASQIGNGVQVIFERLIPIQLRVISSKYLQQNVHLYTELPSSVPSRQLSHEEIPAYRVHYHFATHIKYASTQSRPITSMPQP